MNTKAKSQSARRQGLRRAIQKAQSESKPAARYVYPIQAPQLMPGVLPQGRRVRPPTENPLLAMDGPCAGAYEFARSASLFGGRDWNGFPGYPYLAALSTRPEYRMFAQAASTQMTREWIVLNSTESAGEETRDKCTQLTQDITDIKLKECIHKAVEHDSYYGKAQIFLDIKGHNSPDLPLILSEKTIQKRALKEHESIADYFHVRNVEPLWTTPKQYNAIDPAAPDFYKPTSWFMLGEEVHASRLLTIITREVSDMLKPAFNFGGMSMSQLAEPYVDNWLRTRQSVSDLVNNFSIINLATVMEQALQAGGDDESAGEDIFKRAELFTLLRSNRGLFLTDKDREELKTHAVPLAGLHELQSQAQEQMCSVGHTPAVFLLGIAPTGFGNVAEGEIRVHYDWIAALQEVYWRYPVEVAVNILQLIRYGVIDPDIVVTWQPLYQMTPKELAEIRKSDADRDVAYVDRGILDLIEVRSQLANNPESGYQGIDTTKIPIVEGSGDADETGQELENGDVPA